MSKSNFGHTSLINIQNQTDREDATKNSKSMICRVQSEKLLTSKKPIGGVSETTQSQKTGGKNLKLRDYLFLVGVNSKRIQPRSKSPEPGSKTSIPPSSKTSLAPSQSAHCLKNSVSTRSIKYGIDNRHVLSVVAADLQEDLAAVLSLTTSISEGLRKSLNADSLSEEEMVEVYALRRALKEKVLKELIEIESYVVRGKTGKQEGKRHIQDQIGLSMSIIYEKDELKKKEEENQQEADSPTPKKRVQQE